MRRLLVSDTLKSNSIEFIMKYIHDKSHPIRATTMPNTEGSDGVKQMKEMKQFY